MTKGSSLPLQKGLNKITSLPKSIKVIVAHCDAAGELLVTWPDDSTSPEAFIAGEDRDMSKTKSVDITSGTFSFATSMVS